MVRSKYIYWCISHQQHVAPKARRILRDKLHCKIVRLNLTFLFQVDFSGVSTALDSMQLFSKRHS